MTLILNKYFLSSFAWLKKKQKKKHFSSPLRVYFSSSLAFLFRSLSRQIVKARRDSAMSRISPKILERET
jgi:hypothetical protein